MSQSAITTMKDSWNSTKHPLAKEEILHRSQGPFLDLISSNQTSIACPLSVDSPPGLAHLYPLGLQISLSLVIYPC